MYQERVAPQGVVSKQDNRLLHQYFWNRLRRCVSDFAKVLDVHAARGRHSNNRAMDEIVLNNNSMTFIANILVGVVALLHIYFLVLEMFLWTKPKGLKVFGQSLAKAQASAVLAANQGLYNGFLAAGLIWGLVHPVSEFSFQIKIFFLGCVVVAGIYGAYSVSKKILFVQALPATFALILLCLS